MELSEHFGMNRMGTENKAGYLLRFVLIWISFLGPTFGAMMASGIGVAVFV
jgi:hypothetical protein